LPTSCCPGLRGPRRNRFANLNTSHRKGFARERQKTPRSVPGRKNSPGTFGGGGTRAARRGAAPPFRIAFSRAHARGRLYGRKRLAGQVEGEFSKPSAGPRPALAAVPWPPQSAGRVGGGARGRAGKGAGGGAGRPEATPGSGRGWEKQTFAPGFFRGGDAWPSGDAGRRRRARGGRHREERRQPPASRNRSGRGKPIRAGGIDFCRAVPRFFLCFPKGGTHVLQGGSGP